MPRKNNKKSAAPKDASAEKKPQQKVVVKNTALFEKRPRNFGVGQDLRPELDVTRYVRWPRYIRLQRQKRVLYNRLKVPPPIAQFTRGLDKQTAHQLFALLDKYKPEDKKSKASRLKAIAEAKSKGEKVAPSPKPFTVKYGLNHVTHLVEQKKASLVLIAHDVEPIELVVWLPALCRKLQVPYAIVKGKARLGRVVGKKTSSVLALTTVRNEDKAEFTKIQEAVKDNYLNRYDELRKVWGGGRMGVKSAAKLAKKQKLIAKEDISKVRG